MSVIIGHATGDENGAARGGAAGDQTGKEVRTANWYIRKGGWDVMLVCKDKLIAAKAAIYCKQICLDDSFGYDQNERWTAWKQIQALGIAGAGDSEVDCSSLMDICYLLAGLEVDRGYTGNLEKRYMATGLFIAYKDEKHLTDSAYAEVGCMYLAAGHHVVMALTAGSKAGEGTDEEPTDDNDPGEGGLPDTDDDGTDVPETTGEADNPDPPYVYVKGSRVNVRIMAGTPQLTSDMTKAERAKENAAHKIIYIASKGQKLVFEEMDADTGWYGVVTPKGPGFISNKTSLTKLVTE